MSLAITPSYLGNTYPSFSHDNVKKNNREIKKQKDYNENPISRTGEVINMIKTTFVGGLGLSAVLLTKLVDTTQDVSMIYDTATKRIKDKNILIKIGATVSAVAAGMCGIALLYTIFNIPKIAYESKVKTYKKEKEMDVYIKANNSESMLYEKLTEKAQHATTQEEQNDLKKQFASLAITKNQLPDFIQKENQAKETKKQK